MKKSFNPLSEMGRICADFAKYLKLLYYNDIDFTGYIKT